MAEDADQVADAAPNALDEHLEALVRQVDASGIGLRAQDRAPHLGVGRPHLGHEAVGQLGAQTWLESRQGLRQPAAGEYDALVGVLQVLDGVEELELRGLLSL